MSDRYCRTCKYRRGSRTSALEFDDIRIITKCQHAGTVWGEDLKVSISYSDASRESCGCRPAPAKYNALRS